MADVVNIDEVLNEIYYDPSNPASFSSATALYESVKGDGIKLKEVKEWLEKQNVYTLHRKVVRKIPKRPQVISSYMDYLWDMDTMNMVYYKDANNQFSYVLVMIDIFTRYAWTVSLKTLGGKEM